MTNRDLATLWQRCPRIWEAQEVAPVYAAMETALRVPVYQRMVCCRTLCVPVAGFTQVHIRMQQGDMPIFHLYFRWSAN